MKGRNIEIRVSYIDIMLNLDPRNLALIEITTEHKIYEFGMKAYIHGTIIIMDRGEINGNKCGRKLFLTR